MSTNDFEHVDLGPLETLLQDPEIMEIMINGMDSVYIEKQGKLQLVDVEFKSEDHILHIIKLILGAVGREISPRNPIVDVRLPDGSRVHAAIPPVAVNGSALTIRKFPANPFASEDLLRFGSYSEKIQQFLQAAVQARLNMVIAGGTSSGKTTVFNIVAGFIPHNERIVTAETLVQLQVRHPHVVSLESQPPDADGYGGVDIATLIRSAYRMRPNRILTNDVAGAEVWEMIQVMSQGYDGSMFGMHANNIQDALERVEMMATAATNLPLLQIRSRIGQSIHLILQQNRLSDGTRKIVTIAEVRGLRDNLVETRDLMRYEIQDTAENGKLIGEFVWTGHRPQFAERLNLPDDFFDA